jgi:hypothetical protein
MLEIADEEADDDEMAMAPPEIGSEEIGSTKRDGGETSDEAAETTEVIVPARTSSEPSTRTVVAP